MIASYLRPETSRSIEDAAFCIEHVINLANLNSATDIDEIICTRGPGGYTGIRVGLSSARGFSIAANAKLFAYPSFDVLFGKSENAAAVLPAGRNEVLLRYTHEREIEPMRIIAIEDVCKEVIAAGYEDLVVCSHSGTELADLCNSTNLRVADASDNVGEMLYEFHSSTKSIDLRGQLDPIYGREFGLRDRKA